VDPYQALISTASYQTTFDRTGAMLSGYDLMGGAGPTLRTFTYGVDGMPSRITYGPTPVDSYYDDSGTRVLKYGAQTTVYVGPHFEVRGGVRHRYVFATGTRIALLTPSATYYFHGDHLGSTRAITNGAGAAVWTGSYEPFGRLSSETGTRVSPYLFTGKELDGETGLYYFGARYYDPSTGMFTSADSVLARPYDPQSLNRYAYVGGKPLSRFDPDGHDWWGDFKDWVGKGLNWLGQHSDGGFGVPIVGPGNYYGYHTYVEVNPPMQSAIQYANDFRWEYAGSQYLLASEGTFASKWYAAQYVNQTSSTADKALALTGLILSSFWTEETAPTVLMMAGSLRLPNKLAPAPGATGPHTTFRRDPFTGRISNYETYNVNPRTSEFVPVLRFRGDGRDHGGQPPPLILGPRPGSGPGAMPVVPRSPLPWELPIVY
jgi:RHS repeat-associated protein